MLNVQFYFENNADSSVFTPHSIIKKNTSSLNLNPFTDLIEDEDESETKAASHLTLLCSFATIIILQLVVKECNTLPNQRAILVTHTSPLYVRYRTLLI